MNRRELLEYFGGAVGGAALAGARPGNDELIQESYSGWERHMRRTDYSDYEFLKVEVQDGIAHLEMTRPLYDDLGHQELTDIWRDLDRDPRVRVTLLTHSTTLKTQPKGQYFAHLPPANSVGPEERFQIIEQRIREARQLVHAMIGAEKPCVSTVRSGQSGLHVLMLADIVIVSEDADIAEAHVLNGVAAGDHAVHWALNCGLAKAKLHILTGDSLKGREAAQCGLVAAAVPDGEVFEVAHRYATRLAQGAQHAIRYNRRIMNQFMRFTNLIAFDYSVLHEQLSFFSTDWEQTPLRQTQTDYGMETAKPASDSNRAASSGRPPNQPFPSLQVFEPWLR
jgi:enoyl-CoA hydratase